MTPKTPREVKREISADLRKQGLLQKEAAKKLGYKSKQTLANTLSTKQYLSIRQASRFSKAFGYDIIFLTEGKGCLHRQALSISDDTRAVSELNLLKLYLRRILRAWEHPEAIKMLKALEVYESSKESVSALMDLVVKIDTSLLNIEIEKIHNLKKEQCDSSSD